MDRQTLKQILFQGRQLQRKYKSLNNKNNVQSKQSNCLLGSLQLNQRDLIHNNNQMKRFQIVQLKKYKPLPQNKKIDKYDSAMKVEMKNQEINSHRDTFKVQKLENNQLGLFQKSLGMKYVQKPMYYFQGEMLKNIHIGEKGIQDNNCSLRGQSKNSKRKMQHEKSFLNIQSLAEKFIPGTNYISPKQYKRICNEQKKKIIQQKNRAIKKGLTFDFMSHVKQQQERTKQSSSPTPIFNDTIKSTQLIPEQIFVKKQNSKGYSSSLAMNRASSVTGAPKKSSLIKKMFQQQKQFQQKIQQEKRQALEIRKQVNKNYAKPFSPPENISATSYIVYELTKKQSKFKKTLKLSQKRKYAANSHKVLVQLNSRSPVQVASLTKIMTLIVALQICEQSHLKPSQQNIKIGFYEQNISGTSANIKKGQIYTLQQLFYGLMLPSGNDASLAIAIWGGKILMKKRQDYLDLIQDLNLMKKKKLYYDRFIEEMNLKAIQLNMEKTKYANSHGLMNYDNKSCPFDLAILCEYSLKKSTFKKIVNTKRYECIIQTDRQNPESPIRTSRRTSSRMKIYEDETQMRDFYANQANSSGQGEGQENTQVQADDQQMESSSPLLNKNSDMTKFTKTVVWQNTHGLIHDKPNMYKGIKTGITNAAGPCLASYLQYDKRSFIIIVLNCKSMKQRYKDTQNLRKWTFQKQGIQ